MRNLRKGKVCDDLNAFDYLAHNYTELNLLLDDCGYDVLVPQLDEQKMLCGFDFKTRAELHPLKSFQLDIAGGLENDDFLGCDLLNDIRNYFNNQDPLTFDSDSAFFDFLLYNATFSHSDYDLFAHAYTYFLSNYQRIIHKLLDGHVPFLVSYLDDRLSHFDEVDDEDIQMLTYLINVKCHYFLRNSDKWVVRKLLLVSGGQPFLSMLLTNFDTFFEKVDTSRNTHVTTAPIHDTLLSICSVCREIEQVNKYDESRILFDKLCDTYSSEINRGLVSLQYTISEQPRDFMRMFDSVYDDWFESIFSLLRILRVEARDMGTCYSMRNTLDSIYAYRKFFDTVHRYANDSFSDVRFSDVRFSLLFSLIVGFDCCEDSMPITFATFDVNGSVRILLQEDTLDGIDRMYLSFVLMVMQFDSDIHKVTDVAESSITRDMRDMYINLGYTEPGNRVSNFCRAFVLRLIDIVQNGNSYDREDLDIFHDNISYWFTLILTDITFAPLFKSTNSSNFAKHDLLQGLNLEQVLSIDANNTLDDLFYIFGITGDEVSRLFTFIEFDHDALFPTDTDNADKDVITDSDLFRRIVRHGLSLFAILQICSVSIRSLITFEADDSTPEVVSSLDFADESDDDFTPEVVSLRDLVDEPDDMLLLDSDEFEFVDLSDLIDESDDVSPLDSDELEVLGNSVDGSDNSHSLPYEDPFVSKSDD